MRNSCHGRQASVPGRGLSYWVTSRIQLLRIFFGPGLGSGQPVRVGDPIEQWLGLGGVFTIPGFGDVELAGDLDWGPGAGLVYLRRLKDSQVWRADMTVTAARPRPERRGGGGGGGARPRSPPPPPPGARQRGADRGGGELPRRPSAIRRPASERPRAGNAAGVGPLPPVTAPLRVEPRHLSRRLAVASAASPALQLDERLRATGRCALRGSHLCPQRFRPKRSSCDR